MAVLHGSVLPCSLFARSKRSGNTLQLSRAASFVCQSMVCWGGGSCNLHIGWRSLLHYF